MVLLVGYISVSLAVFAVFDVSLTACSHYSVYKLQLFNICIIIINFIVIIVFISDSLADKTRNTDI